MVWQVARWNGLLITWRNGGTLTLWHGEVVTSQVHCAMETRTTYKCSSYADIVFRIIFQIFILILYSIIISIFFNIIIIIAKGSESDYRLLPSLIASTLSVLIPRNNDLKSVRHVISFALHPTDGKSRRVYSASNSRCIEHGLDKIKYYILPNEIPGLDDKLHYRINLFIFDDAFGYKRYAKYISKRFYPEEINLLLCDGRYAWIKHFSRIFADTTKYFTFII